MIRGTTPTLKFSIPYKAETIESGYITISRKSETFKEFELTDDRVSVEDYMILLSLTQSDTLDFNSRVTYSVQLRLVLTDSKVVASNILTFKVGPILKNGAI